MNRGNWLMIDQFIGMLKTNLRETLFEERRMLGIKKPRGAMPLGS